MKLEVGMYVRTNRGYIEKIKKTFEESDKVFCTEKEGIYFTEFISKTSHNIIDLIEVGDYVNGIRVNKIEKEDNGMFITIGTITNYISKNDINPYLTGGVDGNNERLYQLETIVTKEQFEQMQYKVGE